MDADVIVATSDDKMRERLCAALRGWRLSFAENTEELVARTAGRPDRALVIWDLNPNGEFDLRSLEIVRKIGPIPMLVLDDACDAPRGGRSLSLGNIQFLPRTFRCRALRGAAERCLKTWGDGSEERDDEAGVDREAFEHYLNQSLAAKQVFEHLPVAALVVGENKTIRAINEEARRLTGASADVVGRETCRSLWNCRIPDAKCPLRKAFSRQCPVYRAEIPVSTSHGNRTMIERISTFQEAKTGERRAVVVCGDATGYVRRMRRLNNQAHVDHLTRLLTRGRFDEALCRSSGRVERRKSSSLFVMIDVDGLKQVNDRQGHAAGDRLLRRLGGVLQRQTRRGDLVGRLGGDEFGIRCSHVTRSEARDFVRRLKLAIKQDNARHPGESPLSIGIGASFSGDGGKDLREEADLKLRRYKKRKHAQADGRLSGLGVRVPSASAEPRRPSPRPGPR